MNDEKHPSNCTVCGYALSLGVDAVRVQAGVIGPRGFVTLNDVAFVCDEECLREFVRPDSTPMS